MTVSIRVGDCRELLRAMPDESVACVVTSPPYFGLRDYNTGSWSGGDPACDHAQKNARKDGDFNARTQGQYGKYSAEMTVPDRIQFRSECGKCGAIRSDKQMGSESTLGEYITGMVEVFREVRRVLHRTGTCWLNMGDSYAAQGGGKEPGLYADMRRDGATWEKPRRPTDGFKPKDLMLVPHRLAIALQDDGWWVRSDIIWHKKAPMPESVTDRPTSAHEHIFLLTKAPKYFYDGDAVREEQEPGTIARFGNGGAPRKSSQKWDFAPDSLVKSVKLMSDEAIIGGGRNQRNVWTLGPSPFPDAHFAVFPTEVPRRCIAAGTSERGQCPACGVPWARVVETLVKAGHKPRLDEERFKGGSGPHASSVIAFRGWQPGCRCDAGEPVPQTVLDPFAGACTTGLVADRMGRHAILLELSADYARMGEARIRGDAPMFANVEVAS